MRNSVDQLINRVLVILKYALNRYILSLVCCAAKSHCDLVTLSGFRLSCLLKMRVFKLEGTQPGLPLYTICLQGWDVEH